MKFVGFTNTDGNKTMINVEAIAAFEECPVMVKKDSTTRVYTLGGEIFDVVVSFDEFQKAIILATSTGPKSGRGLAI